MYKVFGFVLGDKLKEAKIVFDDFNLWQETDWLIGWDKFGGTGWRKLWLLPQRHDLNDLNGVLGT